MACGISVIVALSLLRIASSVTDVYRDLLQRQFFALTEYPRYDASLRPYPDSSGGALVVEIDVVMVSVGPVNAMDMTWTTSFYLRQEWTDPRLIVNATDVLSRIHLSSEDDVERVWRPDVFFSNSKDDRKHDITVPNHLLYVNVSSGRVLFSQRLSVVLNCKMNLEKFPHDSQSCHISLESYGYKTKDVELKWSLSRTATDLLPSTFIPDFTIRNIVVEDCTTTYATGTFPCLKATVNLSRDIGYYITETYIPTVLIVVLSWASFWIDHEAVPARISVGLLTVLTITTQLSGSRSQLPRVPYIKAIDVWMSTNLVFVFVSYMEYAVVVVLSRRYKKAVSIQRTAPDTKYAANSDRCNPRSISQEAAENGTSQYVPETLSSEILPSSSSGPASISQLYQQRNSTLSPSAYMTTQTAVITGSASTPPFSCAKVLTAASPGEVLSAYPRTHPNVISGAEVGAVKAAPALDQKDTGRLVDKFSRMFFPVSFSIFNVVYWLYYLVLAS